MAKSNIVINQKIAYVNNKDLYRLYLQDIKGYEPLTRKQEYEYFERLRNGETKLHGELIRRNLLFVISVAKQLQVNDNGSALTLEDLISEGNVGLCIAIDKFDHTKGYKFISYAVFWIKQCILESIKDNIKTVRIPINRQASLHHLNVLERELEQKYNSHVDYVLLSEIAVERGIIGKKNSVSMVGHLKTDNSYSASLSGGINNDSDLTLLDVLKNDDAIMPDSAINEKDMHKNINRLLSNVPVSAKRMIHLYFGINSNHALSYDKIGSMYDYTGERVRQIIKKHLSMLNRKFKNRKHLLTA